MEEQYYCPDCGDKLEVIAGCGSVSYFCNTCKLIISRKSILTKEQLTEKKLENIVDKLV